MLSLSSISLQNYLAAPCPIISSPLEKTGVLLVNLGTPEAPTPGAVRRYLQEFLSDPRVIEIPRLLWLPILYGLILPLRAVKSAKKYAQIWAAEGSPLKVHTARQVKLLKGYLGERCNAPLQISYAMRYGNPGIASTLREMLEAGCVRVIVCPLYPQYAASSTGAVFDSVALELAGMRNVPALHFIKDYYQHPMYISALAKSIIDYWRHNGRPDKLLMSFHGVPKRTVDKGDPYQKQCQATANALALELGLKPEQYALSFQSRFGRARWLEPATAATLANYGKTGIKRVDVICPGFVSDCLETLEEIQIEGKATFLEAGGSDFHYIPALNERDEWIKALCAIVLDAAPAWLQEKM